MPYAVGQRLRCDKCGAEIMFTRPCPCPETESMHHQDLCCGKQMRLLRPDEIDDPPPPSAGR